MKRFCGMVAGLAVFAIGAAAQEVASEQKAKADLEKMMTQVKVLSVQGGVMGELVKAAPYSAVEVTESTQVLADGTRIHRENQTTVYRDSDGRVRRETPEGVSIFDPVAGASYSLDPKTQIARKLPLGMTYFVTSDGPGGPMTSNYSFRVEAPAATEVKKAEMERRVQAGSDEGPGWVRVEGPSIVGGGLMAMGQTKSTARLRLSKVPGESLGTKIIEGVSCEGTRSTETLEAGAVGNDRPIQIVNERWYSPELQVTVMTRHSDPRMGEDTFRLTNVSRTEPSPALFQVPPGYQLLTEKK